MNLGDTEKALSYAIKKVTTKAYLKKYGESTLDRLRKRVKLGYGVGDINEPSRQVKLKPLSPGYKKWRRKNKGTLDSTTTVSKSNLTLTGEMLRDLKVKISKNRFTISFAKKFSRDKAEWNTLRGRPFMQLTKSEKNLLIEEIRQDMISLVKGRLK